MANSNEYMKEYMRKRYAEKHALAISYLGGVCVVCGTAENLEIDHKDKNQKDFEIGKLWSYSEEDFVVELSKCQLLCATHHKEKTSAESSVEHGGGVSGKKNCPCAKCKAKKSEYMRNYKRRKAGVA